MLHETHQLALEPHVINYLEVRGSSLDEQHEVMASKMGEQNNKLKAHKLT